MAARSIAQRWYRERAFAGTAESISLAEMRTIRKIKGHNRWSGGSTWIGQTSASQQSTYIAEVATSSPRLGLDLYFPRKLRRKVLIAPLGPSPFQAGTIPRRMRRIR